MLSDNKDSWNQQAKRYFKDANYSLDDIVYYDNAFPTEKDLNIIGDVTGLKILELGSGFCNCGIALAKKGADVTCLDLSEEQIKIGEELAKEEGVSIKVVLGNFLDLDRFKDNEFDLVGSFAAFQYAKDLAGIFSRVYRILKPGGRFIFSTDHMAMISAWESVPYDYRGDHHWKWNKDDNFEFVSYPKPVSDHINLLVQAGFKINRVEELLPKKDIVTGWTEEEKRLRYLLPTELIISANK